MRLAREQFEILVKEAVDGLPEEFQKKMDNVNITVEARPSNEILKQQGIKRPNILLGLYHGVPLRKRGISYTNVFPDTITIYQESIEMICKTEAEIKEKVKEVFQHELGHHFGMSEKDLR